MAKGSGRQVHALSTFLADLRKKRDVPVEHANKFLRAVGSDVNENLVAGGEFSPGTPVDTGFARASWWPSGEDAGVHPNPPQKGEDGTVVITGGADVALSLAGFGIGEVLAFNNNADYIVPLNNGHSKQAPQGFTDGIVASWDTLVSKAWARLGGTL